MSWDSKNSGRQKIGEFGETEVTGKSPWRIHQRTTFSVAGGLEKIQQKQSRTRKIIPWQVYGFLGFLRGENLVGLG